MVAASLHRMRAIMPWNGLLKLSLALLAATLLASGGPGARAPTLAAAKQADPGGPYCPVCVRNPHPQPADVLLVADRRCKLGACAGGHAHQHGGNATAGGGRLPKLYVVTALFMMPCKVRLARETHMAQ